MSNANKAPSTMLNAATVLEDGNIVVVDDKDEDCVVVGSGGVVLVIVAMTLGVLLVVEAKQLSLAVKNGCCSKFIHLIILFIYLWSI